MSVQSCTLETLIVCRPLVSLLKLPLPNMIAVGRQHRQVAKVVTRSKNLCYEQPAVTQAEEIRRRQLGRSALVATVHATAGEEYSRMINAGFIAS